MSKRMACLAAGATLVVLSVPSPASAEAPGLWSSTFRPAATDCGAFDRDANDFCFIDDGGSVELGVKFRSSEAVDIVGVRAYRTDAGSVTGSLWTADGTRLAQTAPFEGAATHGWQEAPFSRPVEIAPGQTFIASYYAPDADYAFEYSYFTNSSVTAGPITALQSVVGDGNGVFCYDGGSCSFPSQTYRDLNYWVTPLWAYRFTGFAQPVDNNGVYNVVKAGSAIPVKFSLHGDHGLAVLAAGAPQSGKLACDSNAPQDAVEQTVTAGGSGLSYDAVTDQYTYVWKTDKTWGGTCRQLQVRLSDGSAAKTANFTFTR